MSIDAGSGSAVPPLDSGAGSPTPGVLGDTGAGSPTAFTALAMVLRRPFSREAAPDFDPAYPEDGGSLVEVAADWPSGGPFLVRLRDALGNYHPAVDQGCSSAVPGQGDACYANASWRYLRFALPRLRRGTYDLVVSWDEGASYAVKDSALRIVPRRLVAHTSAMLIAIGTHPDLQRRPQDDPDASPSGGWELIG